MKRPDFCDKGDESKETRKRTLYQQGGEFITDSRRTGPEETTDSRKQAASSRMKGCRTSGNKR
jgi:hypothetical protein